MRTKSIQPAFHPLPDGLHLSSLQNIWNIHSSIGRYTFRIATFSKWNQSHEKKMLFMKRSHFSSSAPRQKLIKKRKAVEKLFNSSTNLLRRGERSLRMFRRFDLPASQGENIFPIHYRRIIHKVKWERERIRWMSKKMLLSEGQKLFWFLALDPKYKIILN